MLFGFTKISQILIANSHQALIDISLRSTPLNLQNSYSFIVPCPQTRFS